MGVWLSSYKISFEMVGMYTLYFCSFSKRQQYFSRRRNV